MPRPRRRASRPAVNRTASESLGRSTATVTDATVELVAAALRRISAAEHPAALIAQSDQAEAAGRDRLARLAPAFTKAHGKLHKAKAADPDLSRTARIVAAIGTRVDVVCGHVIARPPYMVPSTVFLGARLWLCDACLGSMPGLGAVDDGTCDLCSAPVPSNRFTPLAAQIGAAIVLGDVGACCRSKAVAA